MAIAQAIATCPGISRSGTTITAGCFVGFDRKFAVRFSFLLSIPAVLGANILTLKDAIQENSIIVSDIPVYLVGVAVAAVVGYICIPPAEDDRRRRQVSAGSRTTAGLCAATR